MEALWGSNPDISQYNQKTGRTGRQKIFKKPEEKRSRQLRMRTIQLAFIVHSKLQNCLTEPKWSQCTECLASLNFTILQKYGTSQTFKH